MCVYIRQFLHFYLECVQIIHALSHEGIVHSFNVLVSFIINVPKFSKILNYTEVKAEYRPNTKGINIATGEVCMIRLKPWHLCKTQTLMHEWLILFTLLHISPHFQGFDIELEIIFNSDAFGILLLILSS